MSLSQGAIEGIKKGDIANEPVTLKVTASLLRSAVMAGSNKNSEHARPITEMSGNQRPPRQDRNEFLYSKM